MLGQITEWITTQSASNGSHGSHSLQGSTWNGRSWSNNLLRDTRVSHTMSTDMDAGDERMEKINVRVPASVLEAIDEEYAHRGYSSRSEAIRDALRDWLNPSPELSAEILEELKASREQRKRDETVTASEARERLGLNDSSGSEGGE